MTISPDVHILTTAELEATRNHAFKRGVERGRFERGAEEPFASAMQIIELGCGLFFGRNGDASHMNSDEYQQAHLEWFTRASEFVRQQRERSGDRTAVPHDQRKPEPFSTVEAADEIERLTATLKGIAEYCSGDDERLIAIRNTAKRAIRRSPPNDRQEASEMMDSATIILNPAKAAEAVCHDEQMVVWASDLVGMLSLGGWLRDDLEYSDGVDLTESVKRELRSIIESAFDHPEAKTIKRR